MNKLLNTSPRVSLTKRKLPISIRFAIRPGYTAVQIRISVNGNEGSPFATLPGKTSLYATGVNWNQQMQRTSGRGERDRLFNLEIDTIRTSINAIYDRQKEAGLPVTPKTIQREFQTGELFVANIIESKPLKWSAIDCYQAYLTELESGGFPEKELVQNTVNKWRYGLTYLKRYVEQTLAKDSLSDGPAEGLTLFWGKTYHRWLMKEGPMAAESATRYVNRLIEAITYIAESGKIKLNPLANLKLPRDKTKDVHFLEPHHLEKFWQLDLKGKTANACWWMGIYFLTGLDHCDAVRYVENRERYERLTDEGLLIVINRSKPPKAECYIPVLPELEVLLRNKPTGAPLKDWEINREMYAVATLIGFDYRLTCKVGRKTGGAVLYDEFEDIGAVSRMMGHSSVSITERYYVKTTGHTVRKAMQKRYRDLFPHQPFVGPRKLS